MHCIFTYCYVILSYVDFRGFCNVLCSIGYFPEITREAFFHWQITEESHPYLVLLLQRWSCCSFVSGSHNVLSLILVKKVTYLVYVDDTTIRQWLEKRAKENTDTVFCIYEDVPIRYGEIEEKVNRIANGFLKLGFRRGDRIAIMIPNHPDFFYMVFACAKIGLTYIPLNTNLKGQNLDLLLSLSDPRALLVDENFADVMKESLLRGGLNNIEYIFTRGNADFSETGIAHQIPFSAVPEGCESTPPAVPGAGPEDVLAISYTSGTTGVPKGVLLTDRMLRCCALGASVANEAGPGEVMLMWESFCHIGGVQMICVCLIYLSVMALLPRFSASRFWDQARHYKATRVHYLGSVLPILLKQPPRPDDRDHSVKIAWGAGAAKQIWKEFENRFGVTIHEAYGMTECSSLTTICLDGTVGSIGKPLPYFELRIMGDDGKPVPTGELGEIQVRSKQPGLILKGYFRNEEATKKCLLPDGWFATGDLAYMDAEGHVFFKGRSKDSLRVSGENVSAWEVERIINEHPDIEECAVIGVPGELGGDDMKVFIKPRQGEKRPDPADIAKWCEPRMAKYQIPRYYAFIDHFEKTESQRTKKNNLSRSVDDCWDRNAKA